MPRRHSSVWSGISWMEGSSIRDIWSFQADSYRWYAEVMPTNPAPSNPEKPGSGDSHQAPTASLLPAGSSGAAVPPVGGESSSGPRDPEAAPSAGRAIDCFHLLNRIGHGGFGDVWLAERKSPYFEHVAIKFIGGGGRSDELDRRFRLERQTLALLGSHPSIAKILDGGSHPQLGPYLVMEYIDGKPLTRFCDDRGLGVRSRVELFLRACDAVGYAHSKGVVHRDLKPGNVLAMRLQDSEDFVKVIDFGLAAWFTDGLAPSDGCDPDLVLGTYDYMSPEQIVSGASGVDRRTDIYALGAMLYRLVTGRVPHVIPARSDGSVDYEAARQIICEQGVESPSRAIMREAKRGTEARKALERRLGTVLEEVLRQCDGGLESVILRALEKSPSERHQSVPEFARAIREALEGSSAGLAVSVGASGSSSRYDGDAGDPGPEQAGRGALLQGDQQPDSDDRPTDRPSSRRRGSWDEDAGPAARSGGAGGGGRRPPTGFGSASYEPDDRIGPYRLIELLREDSFCEVWRANRTAGFEQVVALAIESRVLRSAASHRMLRRGAAMQALCSHPGVERCIDQGTTGSGEFYLVTEYLPTAAFDQACDERSLPLAARLALLARAAEALHAVHLRGGIHRDLKPTTVRVARSGDASMVVRLTGFWIARPAAAAVEGEDNESGVIGTPQFMSPEQASGRNRELDLRTDLYSMGAIVHLIASGRPAFSSELVYRFYEMIEAIGKGPEQPPSQSFAELLRSAPEDAVRIASLRSTEPKELVRQLRSEVDPIVARATQRLPENRYQTAIELARDLDAASVRLSRPARRWFFW